MCCSKHLHQHKPRKYSLQEGGGGARGGAPSERRVSMEPAEEALPEADAADLAAHRSDDPRALRRHIIQPRVSLPSQSATSTHYVSVASSCASADTKRRNSM